MSATDEAFVYKVALCEEVNSKCAMSGAAICQEYDRLGIAQSLGKITKAETELIDGEVVVTYSGGDMCGSSDYKSQITFVCDTDETGDGKVKFVGESNCLAVFEWSSVHACLSSGGGAAPPAEKKGLSTGSIMVIIFFVLAFVYLAAGMAYRFRFKEARGLDMIPNRSFWAAIPGLVFDGVKFTFQTIRGLVSGSSDSYSQVP